MTDHGTTPAGPAAPAFLRLARATVKFSGVTALNALDWEVGCGEVHCLLGENGSGKSTAIKLVAGLHRPEPGALIEIDGRRYDALDPPLSRRLGIQVIYQDLSLFPNLGVAENIAIEQVLGGYARRISRSRMRDCAQAAMRRLGVDLPLDARVGGLPIAERQLVAICRGMAGQARLLFMDEPTASLTRTEVRGLLDVVRRLKAEGVAVVFVSHKLDEVAAIADRVTVLRDGCKRGTYPAAGLDDRRLGALMTGLDIAHSVRARDRGAAAPVLEVRGLRREGEYRGISFIVRRGEIVGMVGLLGAGRTELALGLFGMRAPDGGQILIDGQLLQARSHRHASRHTNRQAIDAGIAYVPEDRLSIGLNLRQSVQDNLALAVLHRICSRGGWLPPSRRAQLAARWKDRLHIRLPSLDAPVSQLSGGNAQRVVLARWLATEPRLLILDSPTVGVDIANKQGIYEVVHGLADQGLAVLMISDEVAEVYCHCDRVLHMRGGEIVGEFIPGRDSEALMERSVYA